MVENQLKLNIWPFSGPLYHLDQLDNIIIVETYPAEFYNHPGLSFSSPIRRSKRRWLDRISFTEQLIVWAKTHKLDLDDAIINSVMNDFSLDLSGEDRFDASIGLYGMINVILGYHSAWEPILHRISKLERWIFAQKLPYGVTGVNRNAY